MTSTVRRTVRQVGIALGLAFALAVVGVAVSVAHPGVALADTGSSSPDARTQTQHPDVSDNERAKPHCTGDTRLVGATCQPKPTHRIDTSRPIADKLKVAGQVLIVLAGGTLFVLGGFIGAP